MINCIKQINFDVHSGYGGPFRCVPVIPVIIRTESAVLKEDQYAQDRIFIMAVLEEYIRETKIFENN